MLEALVVTAVVAVMTGVVSPVLLSARGRGRAVWCSSNIRQMAMAMSVYEQSSGSFPSGFDDRLAGATPPVGGYPGVPDIDDRGRWWFNYLDAGQGDLSGTGSIYLCPSSRVKKVRGRENILCGNYGVNRAIFRDTQPDREFAGRSLASGQITNPSGTLLVTDSGYSLVSWQGAAREVSRRLENAARDEAVYIPGLSINGEREFSVLFQEDAVKGRHPRKTVNVAYADNHVEQISAEKVLVRREGSGWQNRSPLWLP